MRLTDLFLALPGPLLVLAIVAALGPGLKNTLIGVSVIWWPYYARIVRGQVRSIVVLPHVESRKNGRRRADPHRPCATCFPGAWSPIVVGASLDVGNLRAPARGALVPRPRLARARSRARSDDRTRP